VATRKRIIVSIAIVAALAIGGYALFKFPADTTPEGAYMRIARAIGDNEPQASFAYLEEDAQHAAFTIHGYATKASKRIREAYPEPQRSEALTRYQAAAACQSGADVWALMAERNGWITRLRRDLSGVASVELSGERATVVTARGTRYAFRKRPNGIWGLTMFTVELTGEAEHVARDWERIQRAATDYERAAHAKPTASASASPPPP
jgi:hypothetical protein